MFGSALAIQVPFRAGKYDFTQQYTDKTLFGKAQANVSSLFLSAH